MGVSKLHVKKYSLSSFVTFLLTVYLIYLCEVIFFAQWKYCQDCFQICITAWLGVWAAEYLRKEFIIASCRLSVKTESKKLEEYKCSNPLPHFFSLNGYREIRVYSSWWTRAAFPAGPVSLGRISRLPGSCLSGRSRW